MIEYLLSALIDVELMKSKINIIEFLHINYDRETINPTKYLYWFNFIVFVSEFTQ